MKKFVGALILGLLLVTGYALSPVSYLTINFQEELTPEEYIDFLQDNGVIPSKHPVYVLNSSIESYEGIYDLDFCVKG